MRTLLLEFESKTSCDGWVRQAGGLRLLHKGSVARCEELSFLSRGKVSRGFKESGSSCMGLGVGVGRRGREKERQTQTERERGEGGQR